ncbi:hypothetical protein P9C27_18685 [Bacillus vallismortis]|uniref:hypothetical protein n=1 Tax=Bacillus vallismortis TaxID=72361 RepID=UPI002DBF2B1D|nr:hypothetical protein [Bacillus vallismortis]MEC1270491.1 hypothetical protein [Bacillus vallismortis]
MIALKRNWKSVVALLCALALSVAVFTPFANAQNLSEEDQLAQEMQFIFDDASTLENGKYVVNEQLVSEKFGPENVAPIVAFVKMVNGEELTESDLVGIPNPAGDFSTASYMGCLKDKIIDFTGIGFITGGLQKLLEKKLWKEAAIQIIKIVGKNAIKGGVVGLAASLAWFSVRCIGK